MDEGRLSRSERERILREAVEAQAALDLSNTKLAGILGVSRAVISRLKHGTYTGDADKYLRIMRSWLDGRAERIETPDAEYVATSVGEQIITVCDIAVDQPCIGIVKTPSGCGKTSALREVARRLGRARCRYLQAGEALAFKRELMYEIAERIGVSAASASTHTIYRKIRARLAGYYSGGKGTPYLIIIDEATTLRPSVINLLRNLHDEPACRTAIVLADTITRMDGLLYSRRRDGIAGGNEQLRSRSKAQLIWPADSEIPAGDVRAVAEATLRGLGHTRRLDKRSLQYLCKLAAAPGALWNVTTRIHNVHFVASRRELAADYSVSQLDYVASLSGDVVQIDHREIPFGAARKAV